jgi:hypothetical protein
MAKSGRDLTQRRVQGHYLRSTPGPKSDWPNESRRHGLARVVNTGRKRERAPAETGSTVVRSYLVA